MSDVAETIRDHFSRTAPEGGVSPYLFGSGVAGDVTPLVEEFVTVVAGMEAGARETGGSGSPDAPDEPAD